jgi:hypothetical protein
MDFVSDEARGSIHEVNASPKAILEIYFVPFCDWNPIGDDDHRSSNCEHGMTRRQRALGREARQRRVVELEFGVRDARARGPG